MYHYGGIYADISHCHLAPICLEDGKNMVVFRDRPEHPPWAVCNGLIAAQPGNAVFRRAIKMISDNAEKRFYGQWSLEPTGPYLFGRALAQMQAWQSIGFGWSQVRRNRFTALTGRPHDRTEKVAPDGTVVAYKEKRVNSEIREFIGAGGNNYHHIWLRRQIWGEPEIHIAADDPLIEIVRQATSQSDVLEIKHPELRLSPGPHRLEILFNGPKDWPISNIELMVGDAGPIRAAVSDGIKPTFTFQIPHSLICTGIRVAAEKIPREGFAGIRIMESGA